MWVPQMDGLVHGQSHQNLDDFGQSLSGKLHVWPICQAYERGCPHKIWAYKWKKWNFDQKKPLVNAYIALERSTMLSMGKLTISMAIFDSYVELPEKQLDSLQNHGEQKLMKGG